MMCSEKDKMLAGELYDASAPDIQAAWRQRTGGSRVTTLYST
jgi:hypothetical protein